MIEFGEFLIGDIILAAIVWIFGIWCGYEWQSDRQSSTLFKEVNALRKKTNEFTERVNKYIARSEYIDQQEGKRDE